MVVRTYDLELLFVGIGILVIGALSFGLFYYFLSAFVFRRIKLIYKIISDTKKSSGEAYSFETKSIEEVGSEVQEWAQNTSNEITSLKSLEDYRRNYLGNVSHELKTPIMSLQGYLHTLLDGGMYDKKVFKKYLKRAAKNVDRLESIINDLDTINKLEGESSMVRPIRFNIMELVQETIDDLAVFAEKKGISISVKEGANSGFTVYADIDKISQVLNNLVINSIRYGKENGETKIGIYALDEEVLVEVTDDGPGIEEQHLKFLFDRFYRVDPSRSRELGGSGLGLSIAKHILEAHNQTIQVRSSVGVGSTFGFTLSRNSESL